MDEEKTSFTADVEIGLGIMLNQIINYFEELPETQRQIFRQRVFKAAYDAKKDLS